SLATRALVAFEIGSFILGGIPLVGIAPSIFFADFNSTSLCIDGCLASVIDVIKVDHDNFTINRMWVNKVFVEIDVKIIIIGSRYHKVIVEGK
ncbi:hypothetical protein GW17_00023055, partial [Ensete ventricosum]